MGCTTAPPASSELYDCTIGALWGWLGSSEGWHDITAICHFVHSFEWKIWFLDPVCWTIIIYNAFRLCAISSWYFATKLKHKIQTVLRVLGIVCWFQDMFFSNQLAPPICLKAWDLYGCVFFLFGGSFTLAVAAANTCSVPKPKLGRAAHHKKAWPFWAYCHTLFIARTPQFEKKGVYIVRSVWFVEQTDYKNPTCDHPSLDHSPPRSVQECYNTQAIPLANYESKKSPRGPRVHRPWKNPSI